MTELNDQVLLSRYLNGAEDAFRQLLDRHAGLVFGTALRVTGDRGAAEEVSQDVFVLLARKARRLASHPSVAGWLHRTSHHVAQHARRSRLRGHRKVAHLARQTEPSHPPPPAPALGGVDEAVARLPRLDREAILLRFFEDLEYDEIARRLDLSPSAARKRVSRALQRLQDALGADRAAAATSGAFVVVPPAALLSNLSTSFPSATALGSAATSNVLTAMTTNTALKISCAAIAGGVLVFANLHQAGRNKKLSRELASARQELEDLKSSTASQTTRPAHPGGSEAGASSTAVPANAATLRTQVDALASQLANERTRRTAAEKKAAGLEAELAKLDNEVVLAYGKVEEIGQDFATLFSEARVLSELEQAGRLDEEEVKKRLAKFYQSAASMTGLSQQIVEMESDPKEGSQFFAATYAQLFGLDDAQRTRMRDHFARHIAEAKQRELSLAQITSVINTDVPGGFEAELERRMRERQQYFHDVRAELRDLIPAERQADFDKWIEPDGIGFTNITLRGMPLQFSLGGNQPSANPALPPPAGE